MKNNIVVTIAFVIAISLTSCKKKMSEKMKEDFNQVKTDWALFASDLTSFGDTLKANKDKMFNANKKINKKINKSNQDKLATFKTNSVTNETTITNLWNSYDTFQKSFADSSTSFNTWVSKIDTLKTSDKEVQIPIENYKTFLTNSKASLQQWNTDMANTIDASNKDIEEATKIIGVAKSSGKGTSTTKKKKK